MSNGQPKAGTRKVTVGALGGAAAALIVWLINIILAGTVPEGDISRFLIPAEIAAAIATIVTAFLVYITSESYS